MCMIHVSTGWHFARRSSIRALCCTQLWYVPLAALATKPIVIAGTHCHDAAGGFSAGAVEHEAAAVAHAVRALWNACRMAELSEAGVH